MLFRRVRVWRPGRSSPTLGRALTVAVLAAGGALVPQAPVLADDPVAVDGSCLRVVGAATCSPAPCSLRVSQGSNDYIREDWDDGRCHDSYHACHWTVDLLKLLQVGQGCRSTAVGG